MAPGDGRPQTHACAPMVIVTDVCAADQVDDEDEHAAHNTVHTAMGDVAVPTKKPRRFSPILCNVPGCWKHTQGKSVTEDILGPPGRRCHLHGAIRQGCNVATCPNWSKGKVAQDDIFGVAGYRCSSHGIVYRCSVEGCNNKCVGKVAQNDQFGGPGRRCTRHGFSVSRQRQRKAPDVNALSDRQV
eukprot:GEMP01073945.1.p2 GENE.GEMP01073945.1~~GEMP01073945.1.p2  ORF type:complete len:186 (-),score=45.13 GEMP01073945.1:85-642(-)